MGISRERIIRLLEEANGRVYTAQCEAEENHKPRLERRLNTIYGKILTVIDSLRESPKK